MAGSSCSACDGSRLVVPDAFGDVVPWLWYRDRIVALHVEHGWPPDSDAISAGLLHPVPCPCCQPETALLEEGGKRVDLPVMCAQTAEGLGGPGRPSPGILGGVDHPGDRPPAARGADEGPWQLRAT